MAFDSNIPDGFPALYDDQWRIEFQQLSARLAPFVTIDTIHGEGKRYQRLPKVAARQITTRFGDTNPDDIDAEYRWLYTNFKDSAHILDRREQMQLGSVGSPHAAIMRLQMAAARRDQDATLIAGIAGTVQSGKTGGTAISFASECASIGATFVDAGTPVSSGLTFAKLLEVSTLFGLAEVGGQDAENTYQGCVVVTHRQIKDLLREEKLTSADYGIRRLLDGQVVAFAGLAIKAVTPDLLPHNAGTDIRTCYAFAREAVAFGMAENPAAFVDVLPTKRHDLQLRTEWGWGCTRLDGDGVIEILCDESPPVA
ncbi:phage capsid protein [Luteolibacter sp. Populi]|uniref:phage capsid protein n=1 Tax=Luteolibacter sp. Populi TaxID=3230487 RepID=UPI0034679876